MFQHTLKLLTWFSACLEIFNIVFNTIVIICWVLILHTLNQIGQQTTVSSFTGIVSFIEVTTYSTYQS